MTSDSSDDGEPSAEESHRSMLGKWLRRGARRRAERTQFSAGEVEHRAALQHSLDAADFTDVSEFYGADESRRGDDEQLGNMADGELVWRICWLPRTTEVVAFSVAWIEEGWHSHLYGTGNRVSGSLVGHVTFGPERVPELTRILGRSETEDEARALLQGVSTLDGAQAALKR